uniref:Gamma-glutamyltransferase 5a n=1 Tax=Fundulus heteroclitus TaxID=8078 RepID=A0A3Q2NP80_FUNHE
MERTKVYIFCALVLLLFATTVIILFHRNSERECPNGTFRNAAVAADTKKCSEIGRDILQRGGSVVDGAIAALLCTGIMNPQSAGIGGGSMFTVMDSSGNVTIINSRETAPSNVNPDLLNSCRRSSNMFADGNGIWIGVPGEIRGYEMAHKLYGKLPWADLFQPTIKLAREGFPIPPVQGGAIKKIDKTKTPFLWKAFSDKNGNLLNVTGEIKFEKLADTLEMIANKGSDAFYKGKIAEDLVHDVQEAGGVLTLLDLALYKARETDAWVVPMGEYQILILNIMKGSYIDPLFTSLDTQGTNRRAKKITEDSFANHIRSLISDNRKHDPKYYNLTPYLDSMGTTHVSVLAEDGSAVAVTSTINHIFGSGVYSPSTGIILNSELSDFCGRTDNISPGEQPPSSMAPAVLKSDSEILVTGASGGSIITTALASVLTGWSKSPKSNLFPTSKHIMPLHCHIVLSSVFTVEVFNVVKETQRDVEISTTTHSFSSNEFNQQDGGA